MNKSYVKNWFNRHGFKPCGNSTKRDAIKYGCYKYRNRLFRPRRVNGEWVVDVSCPIPEFDRWANSRAVDAQPWIEFTLQHFIFED